MVSLVIQPLVLLRGRVSGKRLSSGMVLTSLKVFSGRESGGEGGGRLEPPCNLIWGTSVSLKMIHSCQQKVSPSSTACPLQKCQHFLLSSSQNISINFSEVHAIDCTLQRQKLISSLAAPPPPPPPPPRSSTLSLPLHVVPN